MAERVSLSEYVLLPAHEALMLGMAITGLPGDLRECKVPADFAAFLQSVLAAMFTSAAERARGGCSAHVQMGWDDTSIELIVADDGGSFHNASESPAALELSRLRAVVVEDGGSLEWYRVGGGPWHTMHLNLPIPPF